MECGHLTFLSGTASGQVRFSVGDATGSMASVGTGLLTKLAISLLSGYSSEHSGGAQQSGPKSSGGIVVLMLVHLGSVVSWFSSGTASVGQKCFKQEAGGLCGPRQDWGSHRNGR